MKTILLLIISLGSILSSFSQSNFERGFNQGYKKGYCLNAGFSCLAPLPPRSPLPQLNESLNTYQDGYNRGFETGLSAQSGNLNERQRYKTASAEPIEYIQRQNIEDVIALAEVLKQAKGKSFELQELGDFQASINIALAGLKVIPKDDEFLMLAGNGYLQLRNYQEALKYFKKAAKISSDENLQELIIEIENGTHQKKLNEKDLIVESSKENNTVVNTEVVQNVKQKPQESANFAFVYIYRPKRFAGSAIVYDLYMDDSAMTGKLIRKMKSNTYFKLKILKEGATTFWGRTLESKGSVMVNVKFGESYFLRCGFSQGFIANKPKLEFIDNETGEREFQAGRKE